MGSDAAYLSFFLLLSRLRRFTGFSDGAVLSFCTVWMKFSVNWRCLTAGVAARRIQIPQKPAAADFPSANHGRKERPKEAPPGPRR